MKVLELFSGTASFSKVATARGHECRTLDFEEKFNPTYCMDIMDFDPAILNGWKPDVVWASPPCQCFSVASLYHHWEISGPVHIPISEGAIKSMRIVEKTLDIIRTIKPSYYFIENPRAMLRKMPFMRGWNRSTITYCQYGAKTQKPTDIWNNCIEWHPRPMCRPRSPCHESAPRGSKSGIQGIGHKGAGCGKFGRKDVRSKSATLRAIVPPMLCEEILIACESVPFDAEKGKSDGQDDGVKD